MEKKHFTYPSRDGITDIHAICWIPDGEIRAILQISHGMVEFIDRYDEFAGFLADRGILVAGNDHLGHGKSVRSEDFYGFFAEKEGNKTVLGDIHRLRSILEKQYPGTPCFLLGHSMGSFLVRQYLCLHGEGLAGAVVVGTGYQKRLAACAGLLITRVLAVFKGWNYRSGFVDGLAFGGYNRKFGSVDGKEWLSRNEENVRRYKGEPLCNFRFTLNGYYNLFYSLYTLTFPQNLQKMPKDLPVFFVAGEDDPVGKFGKGVRTAYQQFLNAGMKRVTCKLYPDDRHEILNELDRDVVYEDIFHWMEEVLRG